jgi:hypothetical protein
MLGITQLLQQAQQAQTSGLLQHAYDLYTSAAEQVNHALPQQTDGTRQQLLQQVGRFPCLTSYPTSWQHQQLR